MEPKPIIGEQIAGRYRVLRPLGAGGMGTVFEVENERFGGRFALKMLHRDRLDDPESVERFRREARAAGSIGHPHIVGVCDVGELVDGTPFLVLELLRGRSLARELSRIGKLPAARAAEIGRQLCEALGAAHAAGIVHRDLKPDNVFLLARRGGDFVKLLDFGVSKLLEPQADGSASGLTQTGTALGTPAYMSPEQITASRAVDSRSDVFALGVVLYQSLTGKLPFAGSNLGALAVAMMTTTPEHPSVIEPNVPAALGDTVMRALARSPDERFPSAAALETELALHADRAGALDDRPGDEALDEDPDDDSAATMVAVAAGSVTSRQLDVATTVRDPTAPPLAPAPNLTRRRTWAGAALAAALVALATLLWGSLSSRRSPESTATQRSRATASPTAVRARSSARPPSEPPAAAPEAVPHPLVERRATPAAASTEAPHAPSLEPTPSSRRAPRRSTAPTRLPSASGTQAPSQPRSRALLVRTEWEEPVEVSFSCGENARTVSLPAFGARTLSLPAVDCRVRCSSPSGLPRCPLRLRPESATLIVRR